MQRADLDNSFTPCNLQGKRQSKVRLAFERSTQRNCDKEAWLLQASWKAGRVVAFSLPYIHGVFKERLLPLLSLISFSLFVTHFTASDSALILDQNGTLNLDGGSHDSAFEDRYKSSRRRIYLLYTWYQQAQAAQKNVAVGESAIQAPSFMTLDCHTPQSRWLGESHTRTNLTT
jgi:hypothetical protein